ncbi:hypothetical protein HRR88_007640 [Exophiala dermatitidis]|nr:hypothetical protein HRR88_007640 [Exophiala dermatitidis]KAJ4684088.1 hypothetical protein HRR93_001510 [Exophiala dermatitidis]
MSVRTGLLYLLIDLAPLQPTWLRPRISYTLREYYLERYQDRYFEHPPAWFTAYMYLEAGYHSPLSLWMIWNIPRDHILVPLHLLLFALETAITTLTCVVDVAAWEGYTAIQRKDLYGLYVPYLVIACIMGIDAFFRVKRQITIMQPADTNARTGPGVSGSGLVAEAEENGQQQKGKRA